MSIETFDGDGQLLKVFECPQDYVPSRFFTRYHRQFVAPVYSMNLVEIGKSSGIDAMRHWAWMFDQLADQVGLKRDASNFGRYVADHREGVIPCSSSKASDVYRTAYLRVIRALFLTNKIDERKFRALSAIVCPLDFSFWGIGTHARPLWWPELPAQRDGLSTSDGWQETTKLPLTDIDGKDIFYATGPLYSVKDELQSIRFSLVPFGYKVTGPDLPSAEDVSNYLTYPTWSIAGSHPDQLSFFDVPMRAWKPKDHEGIQARDLRVLPLLARVSSTNINCWQYDRGLNPLVVPTAYLAQRCTVVTDAQSWNLHEGSLSTFSGFSWSGGPLRRLGFQFNECGQFATVDRNWLQSRLDEFQLKLGFVVTLEYRTRKSEHSEKEEFEFAQFANLDRLISL